jgi:L-amino acid N-acyltransferase YncA
VAELDGAVAGYGYCAPYRPRSAYRYALEDSIFVRHDMTGRQGCASLLRYSPSHRRTSGLSQTQLCDSMCP